MNDSINAAFDTRRTLSGLILNLKSVHATLYRTVPLLHFPPPIQRKEMDRLMPTTPGN